MALVLADRVKESTTTTGTNDFVLGGAYIGFQTFASAVGVNNTTYYAIADGANWEVGLGTVSSDGLTLARTTVLQSSNSDTKVSFGVGQKEVFVTYAADKAVFEDASGNVTLPANLTVTGGSTTDSVQLDLAVGLTPVVGQIAWDSAQGTASLGLLGGNIISRLGQSLVAYVTNAESVTITKGQAVYLFSAQGDRATVKLAYNTGDATSAKTLGIVAEDIAANQTGFIVCQGVAYGLNLSAYTSGDTVYLGATAGSLTATKPYAPNHLVYIGVVEKANAGAGQLYVNVQNGYELDEIHDVSIVSPTTGQTLVYNASTDLWSNSNAPTITGGTINNTTIGATTPSTGVFTTLTATGNANIGTGLARYLIASGSASGSPGMYATGGSLTFSGGGGAGVNFYSNLFNQLQFNITHTASAVNYVQVTGAATGGIPAISAQGSDSTVALSLSAKGGTGIVFFTNSGANRGFRVTHAANSVNYLTAEGSATGQASRFYTTGTDSNIPIALQTTGTGAIDLAAGSSGVNISNGGTVTAITGTAFGSNYTSAPSVVISAPTTAGGVQATATIPIQVGTVTISSGGTGYTVNDVLTVVGGTFTTVCQLTVSAVSGGVITAVTTGGTARGNYTVAPSNPASVTGGTGSGATFTLNFAVANNTTFTITNAGSGYVEQPTVTFSGGGGSGAVAYATVGGQVIVRSLASPLSLYTQNGEGFRVQNSGTASTSFWTAFGTSTTPILRAVSSVSGAIGTESAVPLQFQTNTSVEQLRVAHTASAVNYVQVTGAATGNPPLIQPQGSDSVVSLALAGKNGGAVVFYQTSISSPKMLTVTPTASAVNYFDITSGIAGAPPKLSCQGSDTNIPLVLQPKGTGALQAQQTDSTATGGNARGANAVDWQTSRSTSARIASAQFSVVSGGNNNAAQGYASSASGGESSLASGAYSYVGGGSLNTASSTWSATVGGASNTSAGLYNFVGGGFTNSGTSGSAVTTQSATMNGTTAVILAASNASIKVGQYITGTSIAGDTYVAAVSGTSLTLSKNASGSSTSTLSFYTPHGVVVGGGNNVSSGGHSFVGGGGWAGGSSGGLQTNRATGNWSAVVGGSGGLASGDNSFVGGGGYQIGNGNTASGQSSSVVGGYSNSASGFASVVIGGNNNTATGNYGVVGGNNNTNNGANAVITGGQYGNARSTTGYHVFAASAAPIAAVSGVSQGALIVLGRQTTDATPTVLASDSTAVGTSNQVILPNNSAYYFKVEIIANVTGGGNTSGWELKGVIKRGANAASTAIVGSVTSTLIAQDAGASTWAVSATADTTNGGLKITCTGQASTTIRWVAKASTTEVTF